MKKQYAVLGLGTFGTSVALTLQSLGCEVMAVDRSMERVQNIADSVSYAMCADIEAPSVMDSLGAGNLDGVIVATSENLESSIMATMLAKESGTPYVMAKAHNELHAAILRKLGADAVINPEQEMGARIAKNLFAAEFTDWIALSPDYSVAEVQIPKKWVGKTLKELDARRMHGVNVVGYMEDGEVIMNPDPACPLKENIILILIGKNEDLERMERG